jgi:hypothetical protein
MMTLDLAQLDAGQPGQRKRTSCEWRLMGRARSQSIPLKDTKDTDTEIHFVSFVALSGGEGRVTGLKYLNRMPSNRKAFFWEEGASFGFWAIAHISH